MYLVSGVSARLKELYPKAKYFTHCCNHALNLVLIAGCNNVPDVRNFMQTFKELTLFFKYSAKRRHILVDHFKSPNIEDNHLAIVLMTSCIDDELIPKRKFHGLPVLSDTRWLTRVDSINCLLQNYRSVCEAVEKVRDSSTGQSASDAESFLKRLLSFEFLMSAIICHHVLAFTRPLTVALQGKECDLYKAHKMAQRLVTCLENERESDKFKELWQVILNISANLGIEPSRKRTVRRQQNRSNPPVTDTESYYRVSYYFAFLDHTLSHLKIRFPPELEGALLATFLLPGNIENISEKAIADIKKEYEDQLPYPSSFESEVATWKIHVGEMSVQGTDLLAACNLADENKVFYPNIYTILLLLLSLPVGSCSCERSFSILRRLKTWCRSSMTDERLDQLAIGYINQERTSSSESILQALDRSGHRRIALAFHAE